VITNLLTIVRKSAKHFVVFLVGRIKEVFSFIFEATICYLGAVVGGFRVHFNWNESRLCLGERSESLQDGTEHHNEVRSGELKSLFRAGNVLEKLLCIFVFFFGKKEIFKKPKDFY